jgi:type IV secretory pathway VirB6-like protein
MASIAIVLLIYVSPIVVTLAMFERTKSIFDRWWKQILGLSLQPVILFAYLGVYISIFNHVMVGDVSYRGDGRSVPKSVVCSSQAKDNSIYCIFGIADIGTFSGLEVIGIGLPVLGSMNQTKLNAIIKGAFIMFIFAGFMDKISTLAAELVGGAQLKSNSMSAMDMAKKSFGALAAVQQRALRGMKKHVIDKAPAVAGKIKDRVYAAAFKGMQAKPSIEGKSNDNATQSGGDSAKDKAESSAPRDAATSTPSDASKSESSTKHSEADSSKAHVAPTNDEKFSDASKKGGDDGSAMLF